MIVMYSVFLTKSESSEGRGAPQFLFVALFCSPLFPFPSATEHQPQPQAVGESRWFSLRRPPYCFHLLIAVTSVIFNKNYSLLTLIQSGHSQFVLVVTKQSTAKL